MFIHTRIALSWQLRPSFPHQSAAVHIPSPLLTSSMGSNHSKGADVSTNHFSTILISDCYAVTILHSREDLRVSSAANRRFDPGEGLREGTPEEMKASSILMAITTGHTIRVEAAAGVDGEEMVGDALGEVTAEVEAMAVAVAVGMAVVKSRQLNPQQTRHRVFNRE